MTVLLTRPRADSLVLAGEIEARGHAVMIEPMLTIEPLEGPPPDLDDVQAVLLTSANAAPALARLGADLPVLAVGEATAAAARAAGATRVEVAGGDAADLAGHVLRTRRAEDGALLHLAGTEVRPGLDRPLAEAGFALRRHAVYRARAAEALSGEARLALAERRIAAVLLFSPRTAQIFAELVQAAGLGAHVARTDALCLSPAVALAARGPAWRRTVVAAAPTGRALLGLLDGSWRRC